MKIRTLLFDLDDTLLGNNMDTFLPRYFALLGEYARPLFADSRRFLAELLAGTQAMIRNTDRSRTNRDVFWQVFAERTGLDPASTEAFFDRFYEEAFPALQSATQPRPVAARIVAAALDAGYQVAVATNPLFPVRAIEHRLAWAGLPVDTYDFTFVTSYENMHATKPHPAYYAELLCTLGAEAAETLMVGDDWKNDVEPAASLGIHAYWVAPGGSLPPDSSLIQASGTLEDFDRWFFNEEE